jgi:ABC-type Zn uptake system ZnuABC Zn-binding protein ZnuA
MEVVKMARLGTARVLVLVVFLLTALAVPGQSVSDGGSEPKIVCANSILADFTANIVGDLARVEYLMPAGVCPAHFDSRPSDATMVAGADVVVQMGWEGWLNNLLESTGKTEVPIVRCGSYGDQNLPEDVHRFVDGIAEGLSAIYPEHSAAFAANAESYKTSVDEKAAELKARVEAEGVAGRKTVVMEWQGAFVEWLGFDVVKRYGSPEGLSVQDQLNVSTTASRDDVVMVVDNLQSGTEFGAQVASQTGKSHVILTNFPSAYPNTYTYLDMIEYNTDKLIDGAKTYEYKQGEIADLESQVDSLETMNTIYLTLAILFLLVAVFVGVVHLRSRSRGD